MKKPKLTFKQRLTRPVSMDDVMLSSIWMSVFILGDAEKAFGVKLVLPFFAVVLGLAVLALVGMLVGLVIYAKHTDNIDYFINTPWWWKVGFLRDRKLAQVFQAINKKAFDGKLPAIRIKSTYHRQVTDREVIGEKIIESVIKGECCFNKTSRRVINISIFGWVNQDELLTTMAHEVAHAFQVYDKDCALVAHDSHFEKIYRYICAECGIKPDMKYSKDTPEDRKAIIWKDPEAA